MTYFPKDVYEATALDNGWLHGGDNGGFWFDGNEFESWKAAASADMATTYGDAKSLCDREGLDLIQSPDKLSVLFNGEVRVSATVTAILGAARALPGRSAGFKLALHLLEASPEDILSARHSGWSQAVDGDFLMDCVLVEEAIFPDGAVSRFLSVMADLIAAGVDEVCWRVSVDRAEAEAFLCVARPSLSIPLPLLVGGE